MLLERPDLRAQFGREGLRRVNREFSLDSMLNLTVGVYEQVLGRDGPFPSTLLEQSRRCSQSAKSLATDRDGSRPGACNPVQSDHPPNSAPETNR